MKKNRSPFLFVSAVFLFLFLFAFGMVLGKADTEKERRLPNPVPNFSISSFLRRENVRETEAFLADKIPFRSLLISTSATLSLFLKGGEHRDIIVSGNTLLSKEIPSLHGFTKTLGAMTDFLKKNENKGWQQTAVLVPNAEWLRTPLFPDEYKTDKIGILPAAFKDLIPEGALCDLQAAFGDKGDGLYFRGDHHLNDEGAYLAYREIAEHMGLSPYEKPNTEAVTSSFYGTTLSRLGLSWFQKESLNIPVFENQDDFSVYKEDGSLYLQGFYDREKGQTVDAYGVYLGGNHGFLRIEKNKEKEEAPRPRMLIIRDSFASSLVPYLAQHYDLILLDPRYSSKKAAVVAEEFDVRQVLIIADATSLSSSSFCRTFLSE